MKLFSVLLTCAALLPIPAAAVTWTLQDVALPAGVAARDLTAETPIARITGTFDYDAATGSFSGIDLLVSDLPGRAPGTSPYAGRYRVSGVAYPLALHAVRSTETDLTGAGMVLVAFGLRRSLTRFGGDVPVVSSHVGHCMNADCTNSRFVTSGRGGVARAPDTAPVPLPAGLPLLALGIGALWALRRRASLPR